MEASEQAAIDEAKRILQISRILADVITREELLQLYGSSVAHTESEDTYRQRYLPAAESAYNEERSTQETL